jgi:hypoxanthine phosphoribosyltransferase
VRWDYEPHTFVLERGPDGSPTWAFSPDFYLPDHGRYIEVTTLNQKLVTKKNGKVRKLREVQPLIDIALLYQRDYLELLVRYGLEAPSQLAEVGDDVQIATEPLGLLGLGTLHPLIDDRAPWSTPAAG